jgi:hypothetical protein
MLRRCYPNRARLVKRSVAARKERARLSRLQGLGAKLPQTLAAGAKNVDDLQGRVMTLQEAVSILNLVVVAGTGGVVTWYTWETRQLRHATLRQISLQIRPFLAIAYGEDRKIWVQNLGKGVARDIRFHDVRFGEGADEKSTFVTVEWRPIDFIPEGQTRELIGEGVLVTPEERAEISQKLKTWMANFGPHGKARYEFIADYSDLTGTRYRAAFKVEKGHTELLRDEELPRGER